MDDVILLFYTHSDYIDIAIPSLFRIQKYWPEIRLCLCTNNKDSILSKYPSEFNFKYIHEYKEGTPAYTRIRDSLLEIKENYIVFNIDINVFVNRINQEYFLKLLKLVNDKQIDQVRLNQGGTTGEVSEDEVYEIKRNDLGHTVYYVALHASLWKRSSFLELSTRFSSHSWRCSECGEIQEYAKQNLKSYCVLTHNDKQILGRGHLMCKHFPSIHIFGDGKWRLTKRQLPYIQEFCSEYGIDLNQRGGLSCGCPDACIC